MNDTTTPTADKPAAPAQRTQGGPGQGRDRGGRGGFGGRNERGGRRPRRERQPRQRSEFENKILGIRRVTRVVAGGRRFSFSVTMVIGNGKGKVGVGLGKASDTALAIEKAMRDAQKNLFIVPLTDDLSIPHETQAKYGASEILLIPMPGKGFKAGSAVRTVLELAGVKHVSGKILSRSKNQLNNARATILALKQLKPMKGAKSKKHVPEKKVAKKASKKTTKKPVKKAAKKK
jgi:small subunit ribosomal protein S5